MEFREGDLVVGKRDAPYNITGPGVTCRVVHIQPEGDFRWIRVETGPNIDSELELDKSGCFCVDPKFFMLYDGNKSRDTFDLDLQSLLLGGNA